MGGGEWKSLRDTEVGKEEVRRGEIRCGGWSEALYFILPLRDERVHKCSLHSSLILSSSSTPHTPSDVLTVCV